MTSAADRKPTRGRITATVARAFDWWLSELRAVWRDLTGWLESGGRNGLTIETGERCWVVRRGRHVLGRLDNAASDAEPTGQSLAGLIPSPHRRRPITVEIPCDCSRASRLVL